MKKILIILFSLISFAGFSQSLDSIKHIEIISEIQDSMALINKTDIDKINQVFHELEFADSLNQINDSIINNLLIENEYLDSVALNQKAIILNQEKIHNQLILNHSNEITFYKKELRKSNVKKVAWQSTTGLSLIAIILIILL